MKIGRKGSQIDLGAEMPIGAEKEGRKIAVEIKSFLGKSALDDLEDALGQYGIYRVMLERREPERIMYLAIPNDTKEMLMEEEDFRYILLEFQARLIFYDRDGKEELEWIELENIER